MTQQFTASEVRGNASFRRKAEPELAEMLYAFADLLETREKAVPVMVVNHVSSAEHDLPIGMKLYTHPATSDAERLAEALHMISLVHSDCARNDTEKMEAMCRIARGALSERVTHSAQAQPPAASVTDEMVMRLKRALPLFCADVTMADARAALEAALAAQENPNG